MQPFHREPAFYTTTNSEAIGYNKPDREGVVVRDGEQVRIKHPQSGHQGDYDAPIRMQGEGARWWTIVNSQGNVVYYVLTNGAADMNPNSEYALDRKQKARFYGWYRLGQCPVALLRAGDMHKGHFAPVRALDADGTPKVNNKGEPVFVESPLLTADPCQSGTHSLSNPCPHSLAEADARRKRHTSKEAESAEAYKAHAEKLAAAQVAQTEAITKAMAEQTKAITAGQEKLVGTLASALGAKPDDSEPSKGKRG